MHPLFRTLTYLSFFLTSFYSSAQNDYYFPTGITFDQNISSPARFLGYPVGDWHTRHDRLTAYFTELARQSDQASFQIIGQTNEQRSQIVLTISSRENLARLEDIRQAHLQISDPTTEITDLSDQPVIILLGYNVHGNEPSGAEAAMLTAYYLLAAENEETKAFLQKAVILIDPVYNPDGRDRHSHWANMHQGKPPVADPLDREHNEVWPGGRTNHYWFDLNRDWLPLSQVESRNRMRFYHQWLPNVATDYHEMGTNATYFFEPTKPFGSENPLVPRQNYEELNNLFAGYYEKALNEIGSLYYTKEAFDNSYPGYGSTYPDMQGGLGLLFEQASSRGHLQNTRTGAISFAFTIRNQVRTGIATVRAAVESRQKLLEYQRSFFKSALATAAKQKTKAYLFGSPGDRTRSEAFRQLLAQHQIKFYALEKPLDYQGNSYPTEEFYVVPTAQPQYRMVSTFFEPVRSFYDSVFYDASAWTVALAYNLEYTQLSFLPGTTDLPPATAFPPLRKAGYAYMIDWQDYAAPQALHFLLDQGVNVKTAFKPFSVLAGKELIDFGYGSLLIAVADQKIGSEKLYQLLAEAQQMTGIKIHPVSTGLNRSGIDLGSSRFRTIKKPAVVMVVGEGVSGYEAGEVWHLLDTRVGMPVTKVDRVDFNKVNLNNYNTLLLVSGRYDFAEKTIEKIKNWVEAGNTLITQRTATKWAIDKKLVKEKLRDISPPNDSLTPKRLDFANASEILGAKRIGGSIYETDLDISHPLGFGYQNRKLPVYRNHTVVLEPSRNAFSTVVRYTDEPHLDGYIHPKNLALLKGTASLLVSPVGKGRAILFADNPNFRGFWYGTNRLFFNALLFGGLVAVPR